ncbi:MAG: glycosyltransferase [Deltaproteobacteria bacterium]
MAAPLYAPDFYGGAIQVCRRLAASARRAGHSVSIFAGRASAEVPLGEIAKEEVDGGPLWRVNVGGALAPFSAEGYRNEAARAGCAAFLDAFRPDVLHLHGLQGLGVGPLEAAAERKVPVVLTLHDWWWLCPCLFRLTPSLAICPSPLPATGCAACPEVDFARRQEVLRAAWSLADRVLVPSAFLRDDLQRSGWPVDGILVSPNGIDFPEFIAERPGVLSPEQPLRVAFFGGAGNRAKGLGDLLAAVETIPEGICDFILHATLDESVPARRDLHRAPAFGGAELGARLAAADVLVVPSRMRESFSLVTREAMAHGVAVVATDCGGPQEVIEDGRNGRIVEAGDAAALAAVLRGLASDRGQLASFATAARASAREFRSLAEQSAETLEIYRDVVRTAVRRRLPRARPVLHGTRVLFLCGCDLAPLRYRVHHAAESLAALGVHSRVLFHADPRAVAEVEQADLLILFRTPFSQSVAQAVAAARRRGLRVVFAVDDLIFHPDLGSDAPALAAGDPVMARGFSAINRAYARCAALCDAFIGSTPELADAAESLGLPAFTIANVVGKAQLACADQVVALPRSAPVLGFFTGTATHDADLQRIAKALAGTLAAIPELTLVLGGPVALPAELVGFAERILRHELVGWSDLPALLAGVDLNLAPLVTENHFNCAKSAVKFLEASLVGVPTLGSPFPALVAASDDGRLARLADGSVAWEEALVHLGGDQERCRALGAAAGAMVRRSYDTLAVAPLWGDVLEEILIRVPASEAVVPEAIAMEAGAAADVALEPADLFYDACQLRAQSGEPLRDDAPFRQEILCRGNELRRVDLRFGTYARRNQHIIEVEVRDRTGQLRGGREIRAEELVDRAFVGVELAASADGTAPEELTICVRSRGAAPGNEVLLWRAPDRRGGLKIGQQSCEGEMLSLRTFAESPR